MKIYSIWREGRGGAEGAFYMLLWFFSFFSWLHWPRPQLGSCHVPALEQRSQKRRRTRPGGLEHGTNNPPEKHGGTSEGAGAAVLQSLRKAVVGDETTPSLSAAVAAQWAPATLQSFAAGAGSMQAMCRQHAGSAGAPAPCTVPITLPRPALQPPRPLPWQQRCWSHDASPSY